MKQINSAIYYLKMNPRKVENNEYTNCFRNIFFIMKMLAVFPFYPLHEVYNISQVVSTLLSIISLSMCVIVNYEEQMHLYHQFLSLLRDFGFIPLVGFIPPAVIKLLLFIGPCLTWSKTKQLRNHRNHWTRFQIEMENLTRSSFKCTARNKIRRIFITGIICMCSIAVLIRARQWNVPRATINTFSVFYILNGIANMMTYWVVNNVYIISSAKQITNLVQQTIRKSRDVDLRRLIDLWIMLCDLNEEFINSHSILFLLLFCIVIITGVIGAFSTVILFVYFSDKSLSFTYFCGTVICTLSLMTFCESANSVTNNMVHTLRTVLLSENVNNKNRKLLQMILLFLQTVETKNPQITFNGYMTINRSIVSSVLGTAIYFLVVLKQFSPV